MGSSVMTTISIGWERLYPLAADAVGQPSYSPQLIAILIASTAWAAAVIWLFLKRWGKSLAAAVLAAVFLIGVAGASIRFPAWLFLAIVTFAIMCIAMLRLLGAREARKVSGAVACTSAISIILLWLAADAPYWRFFIAGVAILGATLVLVAVRRRLRQAVRDSRSELKEPTTRKYLYWSPRRIERLVQDGLIHLLNPAEVTIRADAGFLPVGGEYRRQRSAFTRSEIADSMRNQLHQVEYCDASHQKPKRARFIEGAGTIAFSEFRGAAVLGLESAAIAYAAVQTADHSAVAVCLFCSMDNFIEFLQDSKPPDNPHWTFSSSPAVARFVQAEGDASSVDGLTQDQIAVEAIKLALDDREVRKGEGGPWARRPFAFAEIDSKAEWLAEVYHHVIFEETTTISLGVGCPDVRFDQIVVGAPLWIRTSSMRALRLSDEYSEEEIDAESDRRMRLKSRIEKLRTFLGLMRYPDSGELPDQRPRRS